MHFNDLNHKSLPNDRDTKSFQRLPKLITASHFH